MTPGVRARLVTPRTGMGGNASGAIAIIQLQSDDGDAMDAFLDAVGLRCAAIGTVALRDLLGIDTGLVARWSPACAQLMPHGGALLVRELEAGLESHGASIDDEPDFASLYPEARDGIDACALDAIARAQSQDAIDLILEHAERIRACDGPVRFDDALAPLDALIDAPTVACIGPANVGKSSLLNALAKREAALVADMPGTTRDHVGVSLELDGLVVRWLDMPGERGAGDELESHAKEIAARLMDTAALVVTCSDGETPFIEPEHPQILRLGTKSDQRSTPGASVSCSAKTGEGLTSVARAIRAAIVPRSLDDSAGIWRFHPALGRAVGAADGS